MKLVMPGRVPGIHVLAASKQERRGWPGRSPAVTKRMQPPEPRQRGCACARMIASLFGQNAFGRSVAGEHKHDSHGDDAERGQ